MREYEKVGEKTS